MEDREFLTEEDVIRLNTLRKIRGHNPLTEDEIAYINKLLAEASEQAKEEQE